MKNLKFAFILIPCLMISIYACKKEVISEHELVQKHFTGRWPLKSHIKITVRNGDTIANDTTTFNPIDTLVFMADGNYTKGITAAKYSIDDAGENLTIGTSPPVKWTIKHLRKTSIVLSQTQSETIDTDKFTYYTEENLIK